MADHWRYATSIEAELVQGHLDVVRDLAMKLAELPPDAVSPALAPGLETLRARALALAASPDLAAAAVGTARLGATCAGCHTRLQQGPTPRARSLPPPQWTEGMGMVRHQWAADWMWVGLVSASQEAWDRGAHDLAALPVPHGDPAAQAELQKLGREAEALQDPDARADVYAKILIRCAGCHAGTRR
jgi:cytochrome c553